MTAAQAPAKHALKRLAIFTGSAFVLSCVVWVLLVWLSEFGLRFDRAIGYGLIVVLCGMMAAAMHMWRRDGILHNVLTSIVCFFMPAATLPLLAIAALYIFCYGHTACDI